MWKTWLGAALAVSLLLAEAFAVTHEYDSATHANGQACATCVAYASFSAGNVAAPLQLESPVAPAVLGAAAALVLVSVVPARRYARGPPRVSFTL
jgi:hypothetical protein